MNLSLKMCSWMGLLRSAQAHCLFIDSLDSDDGGPDYLGAGLQRLKQGTGAEVATTRRFGLQGAERDSEFEVRQIWAAAKRAGDVDAVVAGWMGRETPLGIGRAIPCNGVFPPAGPSAAAQAAWAYYEENLRKGWVHSNCKSFEESWDPEECRTIFAVNRT